MNFDWKKSALKGLKAAGGIFLVAAGDAALTALATGEVNSSRLLWFALAGGVIGLGRTWQNARKHL